MNRVSQETVKDLDIAKYMGTWYEIAKYPFKWEKGCDSAKAEYTWDSLNQQIKVKNTCLLPQGKQYSREGKAWVSDRNDKGKLSIVFDDGLPADPVGSYWVHWTDYNNAIVGGPSGQYLWWLSRKPTVRAKDVQPMLDRIKTYGYDPDKLVASGNTVTK